MKKLDFTVENKENMPVSEESHVVDASPQLKTHEPEIVKPAVEAEPPKVAPGIKDLEADEPLLQENPHRFVLFPIKYHEVRSCCRDFRTIC